jgi:hypothetical protein
MNTDQEKTLYVSQNTAYTDLAKTLLEKRLAVDLFTFVPDQTDLATISVVSTLTGG